MSNQKNAGSEAWVTLETVCPSSTTTSSSSGALDTSRMQTANIKLTRVHDAPCPTPKNCGLVDYANGLHTVPSTSGPQPIHTTQNDTAMLLVITFHAPIFSKAREQARTGVASLSQVPGDTKVM